MINWFWEKGIEKITMKKTAMMLGIIFGMVLVLNLVSAWGTTCAKTQPTLRWNAVYNEDTQELEINYQSTYCLQADEIYGYLNCGDKLDFAMSDIDKNFCSTLSNGAGGTGNNIWLYDCVGNTSKCCGGADDFDECVSNVDSKWDGNWQDTCYGHQVGMNPCTGGKISDGDNSVNFEKTIIFPFPFPISLPECSGNPDYLGTGYRTQWKQKVIPADELNEDIMLSSYSFYHGDDTHCERTRVTQLGISDFPDCNYNDSTGLFSGDCCLSDKVSGLICEDNDKDDDGYNNTIDCNDNDPNVWQLLKGYVDFDTDTFGVGNLLDICSGDDLPTGYSDIDSDCNDSNMNVHPSAVELCNGFDDNCNGVIDEGCELEATTDFYIDNGYLSTQGSTQEVEKLYDNSSAVVRFREHYVNGESNIDVPVNVFLNGEWLNGIPTLPFSPSEKDWGVGLGALKAGDYNLTLLIDPYNVLNETNEDNNVFEFIFNVYSSNDSDDVSPSSISNLRVIDKGEDFIYWMWDNPNDSDFSKAIVYFDGVNVMNTTNNFYNATGLSSNTSYTLIIYTKDFSGNVNWSSVENTAKTNQHFNEDNDSESDDGDKPSSYTDRITNKNTNTNKIQDINLYASPVKKNLISLGEMNDSEVIGLNTDSQSMTTQSNLNLWNLVLIIAIIAVLTALIIVLLIRVL